jgi:hypothetical protein
LVIHGVGTVGTDSIDGTAGIHGDGMTRGAGTAGVLGGIDGTTGVITVGVQDGIDGITGDGTMAGVDALPISLRTTTTGITRETTPTSGVQEEWVPTIPPLTRPGAATGSAIEV